MKDLFVQKFEKLVIKLLTISCLLNASPVKVKFQFALLRSKFWTNAVYLHYQLWSLIFGRLTKIGVFYSLTTIKRATLTTHRKVKLIPLRLKMCVLEYTYVHNHTRVCMNVLVSIDFHFVFLQKHLLVACNSNMFH